MLIRELPLDQSEDPADEQQDAPPPMNISEYPSLSNKSPTNSDMHDSSGLDNQKYGMQS